MDPVKKTRFISTAGCTLAGLLGVTILWNGDPGFSWWNVFFTGLGALAAISLYGMIRFRYWGLVLGNLLALAVFGFSLYAVHFAWTFWLFKEPAISDRILAIVHPRISMLYAGPLIWFLYFRRESVRCQFR